MGLGGEVTAHLSVFRLFLYVYIIFFQMSFDTCPTDFQILQFSLGSFLWVPQNIFVIVRLYQNYYSFTNKTYMHHSFLFSWVMPNQ